MHTDIRIPMTDPWAGPTAGSEVVIPIAHLGRAAAAALHAQARWEVRAVFRRSFYCQSGGAFVCLGPLALGSGPLNVLCQMPEPIAWEAVGLDVGASARCDGNTLRVADRFIFSLTGARIWRPEATSAAWRPAVIMARVAELARQARGWPARGGLQALVPALTGAVPVSAEILRAGTPLLRMALEGIELLKAWLDHRLARPNTCPSIPGSALDTLLGLGPGLTPSGDDFLGGVLVALHNLGAPDVALCLASEVLRRAGQRTNEISRAHLAAAADGEGLAALHDIISGLTVAEAFHESACLAAIDAIGHTSGWDALSGVVFAAAVMARARAGEEARAST